MTAAPALSLPATPTKSLLFTSVNSFLTVRNPPSVCCTHQLCTQGLHKRHSLQRTRCRRRPRHSCTLMTMETECDSHSPSKPSSSSSRWPLPDNLTPLMPINFRDRTIFVKRDDTLNFHGVSGSKLRKLHVLFLDKTIVNKYDCVLSYGGAQSNAMLALAQLCNYCNIPFVYITRPVPKHLSTKPGNFRDALHAGMQHVTVSVDKFREVFTDVPPNSIQEDALKILQTDSSVDFSRPYFIPQGGAWHGAEYGISILANELRLQIAQMRRDGVLSNLKKLPVLFLPCGTGTTAFYLQKHLVDVVQVIAVPTSGSELYLIKQMRWLHASQHANDNMMTPIFPNVLRPRLRASFADVRPEKLRIWQELCRSTNGEFEFDLIYAPKAWEEVMFAVDQGRVAANGEDLLYYHTGGVEGNVSMLDRFRRKGLLHNP